MNTCEHFRIECWFSHNEKRMSLRIDDIWFVMTKAEFWQATGDGGVIADISHRLDCGWSRWMFYDVPIPSQSTGSFTTKYLALNVPYVAQQMLRRITSRIWNQMTPEQIKREERVSVLIPLETRNRWISRYGQGKGHVRFDLWDEDQSLYNETVTKDGSFKKMIDRVTTIAQNSTHRFDETARLRLSWDGDRREDGTREPNRWYWEAYAPRGQRIMNGGIIFHDNRSPGADPGEGHWSIHT